MLTNDSLLTYAQLAGILTIAFALIAALAFLLKWSIRFRLVGVTSFMGVITVGLFALGLGLFTHTTIPGAIRYSLVYDTGGSQTVIVVPPTITESELEATMRQAASDLFSPGRGAQGLNEMLIRVRTIVHPEAGVSKPVYLGEVQRSLAKREDENLKITILSDALANLKDFQA